MGSCPVDKNILFLRTESHRISPKKRNGDFLGNETIFIEFQEFMEVVPLNETA
jgi:hypothetical protein